MIEKLKEYYRNNHKQLKLIEKFNQEYKSIDALRWYTEQPFLYKQLNRALRTEDIDLLYTFRYFISDLSKNLLIEYNILKDAYDAKITFYRGVKLSSEEAKKIEHNVGQLISTNGYLSTSLSKDIALKFADKSTDTEISVLFEIECDLGKIDSVIMGSIAHYSKHSQEQEVLFDLDAAFQIVSVEKEPSLDGLIIKMKATDEGAILAQEHMKETERQLRSRSSVIIFGRFLAEIGQYGKCQQYFERLLNTPNGEDIAIIYYHMGSAKSYKEEYEIALKYYQISYDMFVNAKPPRELESSYLLNDIGMVLNTKGQCDEALDYHIRALKIRKTYSDYAGASSSLANIGMIHKKKGKYIDALHFFKGSLEIKQNYLPNEHKDIAMILSGIALVYNEMDELDKSLEYHQKSLKIIEKCLPVGHINIALCLHRMGIILTDQGKYDEALVYYTRALQIRENVFPNGHLSITVSLSRIGYIYYLQEKYTLALDYLEKSLQIRETLFPDINDDNLPNILTYFGLIYIKLHKYNDALTYHIRALKASEIVFPVGHSIISQCLTNIGITYRELEDYTKALEYFEKALKNEEQNPIKPNLIQLARNYDNMGICLCYQCDYQSGLEYRIKAVRLIDKVHPRIQHAKFIDATGDIFLTMESYDDALECFFISFNIKLQCLPTDDIEIGKASMQIGDIFIEKEKIECWKSKEQYKIQARLYYEKVLYIYIANKNIDTIDILNRIGAIYENIHKYHIALEYYRKALETSEKYSSSNESIKEKNENNIARIKWLMK